MHVTVLGIPYRVVLPASYTIRSEIEAAVQTTSGRFLRVAAGVLGLCTGAPLDAAGEPVRARAADPATLPLARRAQADYALSRCDLLAYGGTIADHLLGELSAEDAATAAVQIMEAATDVIGHMRERAYPSEATIAEKKGG
jgi:hypothetical protein